MLEKLLDEYYAHILKQRPTTDKAKVILFRILADFTDRRGLRQEWEQIDTDVQEEILAEWLAIIREELK